MSGPSAEKDVGDHIPMPEWIDVYDSEQMIEVCGGCGEDWPCREARKPCRGRNTNVCVGEGCYGESCILPSAEPEVAQ